MSIKEHPPQKLEGSEEPLHVPVLLNAVLETLAPQVGESYLDLTAGYGGHATAILEKTGAYSDAILVDRDDFALSHLSALESRGVRLVHNDFAAAARELTDQHAQFDMVLVDLGVSSPQLDKGERGFSFNRDGPLDMRMDRRQHLSAFTLVNKASPRELERVIHDYGEETLGVARRYTQAIIQARPIETTAQLASIIGTAYRGKWAKVHPATRTFQALRIAVNDELGQIETLLPLLPKLLRVGGRVGVISFHSLEDRLVKRSFKEQFDAGFESELAPVTKKPILGALNDAHNPRARSAKLRVAVKP